MILCLDVGNSQIYGGVFNQDGLNLTFRRNSKSGASSDEIGLFLRSVLRENNVDPDEILHISLCSVVPEMLHSLRGACQKYFHKQPFVVQAGVRTGLKIKYQNPLEVGADRIANAIAAVHLYPGRDLIIIDFGTATTFCAVNQHREYLGGVILAGVKISMEALESRTSKLPAVEIVQPEGILGRSTVASIQSGLFYGSVGATKEIIALLKRDVFGDKEVTLIGTGGFARLFDQVQLFNEIRSDLVLQGLKLALEMNL